MSFLALRLNPGDDLRRALEAVVRESSASCFIVCGIGSLSDPTLRFAGAEAASSLAGPWEILTLSGSITPEGAHLHMVVADDQGRVCGGHVGYGNRIRTTAEILFARLNGGSLSRAHDAATGYQELVVHAAPTGHELSPPTALPSSPQGPEVMTDTAFRSLERARTQALVAQDMATVERLHAPDYQLITPAGKVFDRAGYLAVIASGELRYTAWQMGQGGEEPGGGDPSEIAVRHGETMAIVRYPAVLHFPSGKQVQCWHTDSWELRDGRWQAVWSQATARP